MDIEKILVYIRDKEYSFSVEILHDENETVYRATPDQGENLLDDIAGGYIEFDENGHVQSEERQTGKTREINNAIWRGIEEQILAP